MSADVIRIATRESPLALWQANHVRDLLELECPDQRVEIVALTTSGDRDRTSPLSEMGGVGVFTREIQHAVLDNRADVAVHSLKDLPTEAQPGLNLAAVPRRGPVRDCLLLPEDVEVEEEGQPLLPYGASIGTSSLRRRSQLLAIQPDLNLKEIRGNVETRLRKLDAGEFDAIVLAEAGLVRLGLQHRISLAFDPVELLPAVGQGALGIECRTDDVHTQSSLLTIADVAADLAVHAERAFLAKLQAGCHAPVGAHTEWERPQQLTLTGVVLSVDGRERLDAARAETVESRDAAESLGVALAEELLDQGAAGLVELT